MIVCVVMQRGVGVFSISIGTFHICYIVTLNDIAL